MAYSQVLRLMTIPLACIMPLLLGACTAQYQAVGGFDDHNEVFVGDIKHNLFNGTAQITAKGQKTGMVCKGQSRVTEIPNPFALNCAGQRGVADLTCTDGRIIHAEWVAENCTNGTAVGKDQNGNTFRLRFGMNAKEAQAAFEREAKRVANKPDLPKIYDVEKTHKEKGFATGTGFFISEDGLLLTNYHVIERADKVGVLDMFTEEAWLADVVYKSEEYDFAILKVEANARHALPLHQGGPPRKGEEVIALGYPMISIQGQEQKATFGRINALSGIGGDKRYYQMDAPIQPGNSGGPLLNMRGEVIGINTMTASSLKTLVESGSIPQNINYAVKIDAAVSVLGKALESIGIDLMQSTKTYSSISDVVEEQERGVVLIVAE